MNQLKAHPPSIARQFFATFRFYLGAPRRLTWSTLTLAVMTLLVLGLQHRRLGVAQHALIRSSETRARLAQSGIAIQPQRALSKAVTAVVTAGHSKNISSSLPELAALLVDASQPMRVRRQAAWRIAHSGSDEAFLILRRALMNASPTLKATIAEALGHSGNPAAKAILDSMITDSDEAAARGAIRGLAALGDLNSTAVLSGLLQSTTPSEPVRAEAALALGGMNAAQAVDTLIQTALYGDSPELAKAAIIALGRQPFAQTQGFYETLLKPTNADINLRALALESLAENDVSAASYVLSFLNAEEAEIRAAAAWALANMEEPGEIAPALLARLDQEPDPEVRTRLYQALENQTALDGAQLIFTALAESDTTARIAALNLLASRVQGINDAGMVEQFDNLMVPWLAEQALKSADLQTQMSAMLALRQAGTPKALQSLNAIAIQVGNPKVIRAAQLP